MEADWKDGYYFYVLSLNEDGTTNLIMDRNICEDGTVVPNGYKGIVTNRISSETITEIIEFYGDITATYKNLKARLPYYSEVSDYNSINKVNMFLYNNLNFGCYDNDMDYTEVSCDIAGYIEGINEEGLSHISGQRGYRLLATGVNYTVLGFRDKVLLVHLNGTLSTSNPNNYYLYGIRPVITLKI